MLLPRKRLSDITNLSINENGNGLVSDDQKIGKIGSPVMVNEYITKLLKENNAIMRALAERNTEVQNLRLMVAKINQQNWQLAQAHSQMLTELNLGKDRVKAAQHELGCTSAALKVKAQELEELKKLNRQNKRMQNKELQPLDNALADTSSLLPPPPSQKKICPPNRKRPMRSRSLGPLSAANQPTTMEAEENLRKPIRRRPVNTRAGSCVLSGDLFEIEDARFPVCPLDKGEEWKDEAGPPSSPTIKIKVEQEDHFCSSLENRTSLGRPLRRAAVKVNSYREMPLKIKLRRPE